MTDGNIIEAAVRYATGPALNIPNVVIFKSVNDIKHADETKIIICFSQPC